MLEHELASVSSSLDVGTSNFPEDFIEKNTNIKILLTSFCAASTRSCTIAISFLDACEFRASVSAVIRIDSAAFADAALTSSCSPSTYTGGAGACAWWGGGGWKLGRVEARVVWKR